MVRNSSKKEPSNAPVPERWYNLTLGSSFKHPPSSSKFTTLRYHFRPASVENQAGSLHKSKDNRVTVELQNNQPGKPKFTFEGYSEDCKDNDAVLFFDGETFRLERLHRAVLQLKSVGRHGESSSAAATPMTSSTEPAMDSCSPQLQKTPKMHQPTDKMGAHRMPVEMERIDIVELESPGPKLTGNPLEHLGDECNRLSMSPEQKNCEIEENLDVVVDDDDDETNNKTNNVPLVSNIGFDINMPAQIDSDEEIADVDVSDDEGDKGTSAAAALRAQVTAEGRESQTSSSSGSSGSDSSGSGSGSASSSSDSEGSDDESSSSGGDVDVS